MPGRLSRRLFGLLTKADYQREFDRVLRQLEDDIDAASVQSAPYGCPSDFRPGHLVFLAGKDTIAKADASDSGMNPVLGFVLDKPTATTARVRYGGELAAFDGLLPGTTYYLSMTPGEITTEPPNVPGSIVQKVGVARNETTLVIQINRNITVVDLVSLGGIHGGP
jgi:hypothetical protein